MEIVDSNNQHAIRAIGLVKEFGKFPAVDGIDFEVQRGEIFGFLGPNGSGKTTTIRMMLGLLIPTQGDMEILGFSVKEDTAKIRPKVGYMSQKFSLYNDLTVEQNLRFHGTAYGLDNRELTDRMAQALEMAGLVGREKTKTQELSGGWRQRLALGAAVLHEPLVLFLDEPTAGVDPVSRREFWELLYRLVSDGVTVFVTTHYMDEAEHCHRLAFIRRGRIIARGTPDELRRDMMPGEVLEMEPSNAQTAVRLLQAAKNRRELPLNEVELYGSLIHVIAPEMKRVKGQIEAMLKEAGIDPGPSEVIEPSLEDVFIAAMKEDPDGGRLR
jgi:ABC-2 type transport system ATP-binding protein